jgi:signal peptidase II
MLNTNLVVSKSGTKWLRWLVITAIVLLLDQATKFAVTANFQLGEGKAITSFFNIVLAHNKGAGFSFLADQGGWQRYFFIVLTSVIAAGLMWLLRGSQGNKWLCTALALVLGGAFGNLIDRIAYGYVVDFIQWYIPNSTLPPWPTFNIADSAICIGAVMMVIDSFRKQPLTEVKTTEAKP